MPSEAKPDDLLARAFNVFAILGAASVEIYHGVRKDRIPAHKCCFFGMLLAIALMFHLDQVLFAHFKLTIHIPGILRWILELILVFSGWILWGLIQATSRNSLLSKLKSTFEECKWKTAGKYPSLIEDVEVDGFLRKLRLKANGTTLSAFEESRDKFEHMLNVSVVKFIAGDNDKSIMEILYTTKDLMRDAILEHPDRYPDGEIPIGISFEGPIKKNLRDVGHILVAGQTGGGKSNFLKLALSILSLNNKEAEMVFLDFKGGMESADLKNQIGNMQDNITYVDGTSNCAQKLESLGTDLKSRLEEFKNARAPNIDEYLKLGLSQKPDILNAKQTVPKKKIYIIIDELAQLYAKEPGIAKKPAESAKAALNQIARQGRAAGMHIIAATQKPDSNSFDQTVKANLPGVLCFPMANQASSVSAIGSKRAFELNPDIKGRAVWKFGPKVVEVQTYLFS